jgi:hypothetical protein
LTDLVCKPPEAAFKGIGMDELVQQQERKRKAYAAPIASILSAIGSMACCLPLAFLGALGAAGASAAFAALRPWLLAISGVLLVVGSVQLYRGGKWCRRRSMGSVVIFWIAVGVFLAMLFFPQQVAALLAGRPGL